MIESKDPTEEITQEKEKVIEGSDYVLRVADTADIPFFYNSWLKSYRESSVVRNIPHSIYYDGQHRIIEKIMGRPGLFAVVACNPKKPEQIFGYIVGERRGTDLFFHWVYVKYQFRGFGIARSLEKKIREIYDSYENDTRTVDAFYSHRTKSISEVLLRRQYVYNPYAIWSYL